MSAAPDVLIVGAGPAGATAALTLARAGARVRVIDRARFPRNKPCGGAISMRVLGRFPHLRPALTRIPTHLVSKLYLESPGGDAITLESDGPAALMIRRVEFDNLLRELALEAGVRVDEGVEIVQAAADANGVELLTRAGVSIRAPMVIAADGVNSVVARRLGFNRGWSATAVALDMMEETPNDTLRATEPGSLWVGYGFGGSEGYAYVFPKAHHVNVGIGYLLSYFRTSVDAPPYQLQAAFVDQLRRLGVLDGRSARGHFTPFLIPVGGPLEETARERVLVAGDAGGFVNGFTAEGIYYAMVTGDLAARAVLRGQPLEYPRLWRREVGAELRDSVLVQRFLFGEPGRVDGMIRGAQRRPDLAMTLVEYAMGRLTYQTARRRLVFSSPGLLLDLAKDSFKRRRRAA